MHDTQTPSLPNLQYHLSSPSAKDFGWITVCGERVHLVTSFDEFYEALGYTDVVGKTELLPDEYIWERYTRDGAVKSAQCLQVQVAAYLREHSAKFNAVFGHIFDTIISKCTSDHIDSNDAHCVDCPSHPHLANFQGMVTDTI